jgi:hypothetical protein
LLWDGFIVQRPVEDCWDGFGTFFFTKRNFLQVPLPGAKPDALFVSLWAFFHGILLGDGLVYKLMEVCGLEQVQSLVQVAI